MTDDTPERIGLYRNAAGEWEKRFIWPEFEPNSDETVYVRADAVRIRKCPNCHTMTEVVNAEDIERSLARRMIAAEDLGIRRGEERHDAGVTLARIELATAMNFIDRGYAVHEKAIKACLARARDCLAFESKEFPTDAPQ